MKRINIKSEIGQIWAEQALRDWIQNRMNLHPGMMLRGFRKLAKREQQDIGSLFLVVRDASKKVHSACFTEVIAIINGEVLPGYRRMRDNQKYFAEIEAFFHLKPEKLVEVLRKKFGAERPYLTEFSIFLDYEVADMMEWAFDETLRLYQKEN